MTQTEPLLAAPMHVAPAEILLIDAATLALVDLNATARAKLGYDGAALHGMRAADIAPSLDDGTLHALLASLGEDIGDDMAKQGCLRTELRRADGSTYPARLTFLRTRRAGRALLLAIGDDLSPEQAASSALAQALASALGLRPVFVRSSWPGLSQDLQHDAFDIAIGGVSVTPERARLGRFSRAYHEGGKTFLARCADAARFGSVAAVNRPEVRLIVNRGGTNESVARALLPQASLRVHPDNIGVFAEVAERRADVMLTDDVEADLKSKQDPRLCRSLAGTLNRVSKALWMQNDPALAGAVDSWLERAISAGDTARWMDEAMRTGAALPRH